MNTFTMKVIHAAFEDAPVHVATVTVEDKSVWSALEQAWRLTQNIEGSWSRTETFEFDGKVLENLDFDERVTVEAPLPTHNGKTFGLRSTSIRDMVEVDGVTYVAAMFGFEILEETQNVA